MLYEWAPDMYRNISGARLFNLRLEEALSVLALSVFALLLVGPLELARGNKPNDHGPHNEDPVRVG